MVWGNGFGDQGRGKHVFVTFGNQSCKKHAPSYNFCGKGLRFRVYGLGFSVWSLGLLVECGITIALPFCLFRASKHSGLGERFRGLGQRK